MGNEIKMAFFANTRYVLCIKLYCKWNKEKPPACKKIEDIFSILTKMISTQLIEGTQPNDYKKC